jgi:3-oxoadipate enol-lactonase
MPQIDVNGTTLHYEQSVPPDRPDAPALVFGHSLFFDHRMFDAQAERFAGSHRVVRYDHRGQGASARAPREQLDMDTLTDDAAALIEALGLAPCTYVGNSMGGFVALRLAARRPDLVRSVAVLGSSGDAEEKIAEFDPLVVAMGEVGVNPVLDTILFIMLGDTTLSGAPERAVVLGAARERIARLLPDIADAAWQVVHRDSVLDELTGAAVPILVIAGDEDHAYPPEKSRQIAEAAPNAELHVVSRAGHSVAFETPDAVNALLAEHLEALPVG